MNKEIDKLAKNNWPDMYEAMERCAVAKTDPHKLLFLRFNCAATVIPAVPAPTIIT